MILAGWLDVSGVRQLANRGSLSGALVGGLLFGVGMVMTRGCASRLLILSANGNLRALLSGLVFAVTAQATLAGSLAPLRSGSPAGGRWRAAARATCWPWWVPGHWDGLVLGAVAGGGAVLFLAQRQPAWMWLGGLCTGLAVALAWWFKPRAGGAGQLLMVPVQEADLQRPLGRMADARAGQPRNDVRLDAGMLPAVFVGSLLGALVGGVQDRGFDDHRLHGALASPAPWPWFGSMPGGCAAGPA